MERRRPLVSRWLATMAFLCVLGIGERHAPAAQQQVLTERGDSRAPMASHWQVGDSWTVQLEYGIGPRRSRMHITVTGAEAVEGEDCWRLEFVPAEGADSGIAGRRRILFVSKQDGQVRREELVPLTKAKFIVRRYGDLRVVWHSGRFPTMIVPVETGPEVYVGEEDNRLRISRDQVVDIDILTPAGDVYRRVRQVWPAGAKWWSEYELWGPTGLELRASLITPDPTPPEPEK